MKAARMVWRERKSGMSWASKTGKGRVETLTVGGRVCSAGSSADTASFNFAEGAKKTS